MSNKDLATHIARRIFECGDDHHAKTTRIQFRGMRAGDEIGLGGFVETALARFFDMTDNERLDDLQEQVNQFNMLQLPGQPQGMHMSTSYLVGDLWTTLQNLKANE